MPPGLDCYKSVKKSTENCIPCNGIYFHVEREDYEKPIEDLEKFKTILDKYKEYKSGITKETEGKLNVID